MRSNQISDSVEAPEFRNLMNALYQITGIPVTVCDASGLILVSSDRENISQCADFSSHFPNCQAGADKQLHNTRMVGDIIQNEYKNGLLELVLPIIIEGRLVGTIIAGQFMIAHTDSLPASTKADTNPHQPTTDKSHNDVPIVDRKKLSTIIEYYRNFVRLIAMSGKKELTQMRTMDELKKAEEKYRLIAENATDVIWTADLDMRITFLSPSATKARGQNIEQIIGLHIADITTPKSFENLKKAWTDEIACIEADPIGPHGSFKIEAEIYCGNGTTAWIEAEVTFLRGHDGKPIGVMGVNRDIGERKRVENHLRTQISAMNAASDQIVITDTEGNVEFVNQAFERETGYSFVEVEGKKLNVIKSGQQDISFYDDLWQTIRSGETWHGEIINRRKNGSLYTEDMCITPVMSETGEIRQFIAIKRDVTEKKTYEKRLDHLAHHDALTGLPNRLLFSDCLATKIEKAKRDGTGIAVMFIDLDRFKFVNDTLGHSTGDQLLKKVSSELIRKLRGVDTVARMGGDEFTVTVTGPKSREEISAIANRVIDAFRYPFVIDDSELFITASVGISLFPEDGIDGETLVRNADTAMYCAKEQGRNNYQFYKEELNALVAAQMNMDNNLRRAVDRNEFVLMYQPQINIETGEILGVEALVRWMHPEFGLIPPAKFIPLAEETGLILPISDWVLKTACQQNKKWQDAGFEPITVSVNVSARQLWQGDLVEVVKSVLRDTGMDPKHLGIELTESALMQDLDLSISILSQLKSMGVKIAIDDFGTGYSSLSYLKRLPIDTVKVDQSFIRDITTNPDDAAIAGAVVAMAHSLKLNAIAEGVETIDQLEFLRSLKYDEVQGYFISRPVPADNIGYVLKQTEILEAVA